MEGLEQGPSDASDASFQRASAACIDNLDAPRRASSSAVQKGPCTFAGLHDSRYSKQHPKLELRNVSKGCQNPNKGWTYRFHCW